MCVCVCACACASYLMTYATSNVLTHMDLENISTSTFDLVHYCFILIIICNDVRDDS